MALITGLEKFGFGSSEFSIGDEEDDSLPTDFFEEEADQPHEEDFIYEKECRCPMCNSQFTSIRIISAKELKRSPDFDLRPRDHYIDPLKYAVTLCTKCGYAALNSSFDLISESQAHRVRETVINSFNPDSSAFEYDNTYTLAQAIDRAKLALLSTIAKRAKLSEGAYICLVISWLLRDHLKEYELVDLTPSGKATVKHMKWESDNYYHQAYKGLSGAAKKETPPYCGLDTMSLTFILANMSFYFRDYPRAKTLAYALSTSKTVSDDMKTRCQDILSEIDNL